MLELLAEGLGNAAIAERLWISHKTVKSHVSNILGKLHLADRTQAAVYAGGRGWLPSGVGGSAIPVTVGAVGGRLIGPGSLRPFRGLPQAWLMDDRSRRVSRVARLGAFALSVAATGVAIGVAEELRPIFAQVPTLPFTAAAAVVAWRAGLGAALTTLGLGTAAVWFFFLPPIYSWQIKSGVTLVQLAGFVGVGVLVAWAIDSQRAAQAAAEAALRERDRFLEAAAHELRTPVTVLKGTAELLVRRQQRGRLDEERLGDGLRRVVEAGERLALLVDDLLDISRLRTGRLTLRQEPIDLTALTREVTEAFGNGLEGSHRLEVTTTEGPLVVRGDPVRLAQVLNHLLDNAAKFSPDRGAIRVEVGGDGDGAWLTVRDEGIGLAPGSAVAIFAPGHRAANQRGANLPGLGLGLGICREIVGRHGGRMVAESAGEGHGTTVRVWLPTGGPSG